MGHKQNKGNGRHPETPIQARAYLDAHGCRIEIGEVEKGGVAWLAVFRIAPGGVSVRRINSPSLPLTRNRARLAEALAQYAQLRAWKPAE